MNMISQGQIAAGQRKLFEGFVAGVAVAAIAIALAWGAFAVLSASNSVAPSRTTIQTMQEPGLLEQRAGERGGPVVIPSTKSTVLTDGLVEQRRGERGGSVAIPSTKNTIVTDSLVEQRRGERSESVQKTGTKGFNGFGNTGYGPAMPALDQSIVEHLRGEHGPLR